MSRNLLLTALLLLSPLYAANKAVVPPQLAPAGGAAAANFSPGILVDGTLYLSGTTGEDLKTNQIPANFEAEVKNAMDRLGLVLKAAGMTYSDVVAVNVFLTDMDLFPRMNTVYRSVLPSPRPARTTVGVTKLAAPTAHIEINMIAHK